MPTACDERPTTHDEAVPLVPIDGDAELVKALGHSENSLEVSDAAVCVVMLHGWCLWLSLLGVREQRLTTQAQRRLGDGAAAAQAADVPAPRRSLQRLVRPVG